MKKLLALVLAMVMTLGLATVSSSAAYSDAADVSLEEAVDVMSAVGVFQGADGKFSPKANLNREQAAKLIAYLDLGETAAEALPAVKVFSDVPATSWSAKYIAYCADAGYIAGDGTGKFNPAGELNGYAFGKMLLCVLGYDAGIEGFVGNNWSINVAKLMEKNDIADGIDSAASATLTREQAAQYCLNALKAPMVDYDTKGTNVTINGAVIATGASKAEPVTKGNNMTAITNEDTDTLQLGEKLYKGDLTYGAANTDKTDDFGRPVVTWQYKNKNVATHNSTAKVVFTADTSASNVATALKGYKFNGTELKNKDVVYAGNGDDKYGEEVTFGDLTLKEKTGADKTDATNIANAIKALTANGKVVEFYADSNANIIKVVTITYKVEKITNVTTNKDGDVTYNFSTSGAKYDYADDYAKDDTVVLHGTFAKNDYVTTVVGKNSTDLHVYPTTKVVGKQTATDGTTLTISGTKYKLGKGVTGCDKYTYTNSSKDANYFLDQFGFVVASSDVEADLVYAVVNKIAAKSTDTGLSTGKSAEAELVFTDGTKSTVKIAKINGIKVSADKFTVDKSNSAKNSKITWTDTTATAVAVHEKTNHNTAFQGQIVSYEVDSDGKYELTFAKAPKNTSATGGDSTTTALTNKGVPAFGTGDSAKSGTSATVYVVKTKNSSGDEVFKSYTGFANVPTIEAQAKKTLTAYYVTKDAKVVFVYIDASANSDVGEKTTANIFYVTSDTVTTTGTGSDKVYTVAGILDGKVYTAQSKVEDFKVVGGNSAMAEKKFYTLSINEDGYVTAATEETFTDSGEATGTANQALIDSIETGTFGGYLTDSKTEVYVIDDGKVSTGSAESIAIGDHWYALLNTTGTAAEKNTIKTLYIVVA